MAELKLGDVKKIATRGELELYQQSRGRGLTSQSREELQQSRTRTREFRKKWRDQYAEQRRAAQQSKSARPSATLIRTQLKVQMFQEMLARFEARIQAIDSGEAKAPARKSADRPSKETRNRQERASRAEVRDGLRVKKKKLAADNQQEEQPSRPASKNHDRSDGNQNLPDDRDSQAGSPKVFSVDLGLNDPQDSGVIGTTRRKPDFSEYHSNGKHSSDSVDPVKQVKTRAAAKQKVIDKTGLTSRVLGHVSSQGRRNQAARNTRKRT